MFQSINSVFVLILNVITFFGCSSSDETQNNFFQISDENNVRLIFENSSELKVYRATIEELAVNINVAIQQVMPIDDVNIRFFANQSQVIPEIGIGGFNPSPNEILIYIDPDFPDLKASLGAELPAMIAHEIHHANRQRSVGYGNTLLEAIISEGLADHFSVEVTGIDPPRWSTALQSEELQDWIATASQTWNDSSYDHPQWFFGSTSEIPRWTGYSMGYELVKKYLENNRGKKPSNLDNEPVNSFLP